MAKTEGKTDNCSFSNTQLGSLVAVILVLIGLVSWNLQHISCIDCVAKGCEYVEECKLFEKEWMLSFLLIVTHLIPFALIPLTMCIVRDRTPFLLKYSNNKNMRPFTLQLGLGCMCIAFAFVFGSHVNTMWYYRNEFRVLEFFFFLFLISSFALWADGLYTSRPVDVLFAGNILLYIITYPIGAAKDSKVFQIPIYWALTVSFVFVTTRGMTVLNDSRMLWVPFFSVGVNLIFIFLLNNTNKVQQNELTK